MERDYVWFDHLDENGVPHGLHQVIAPSIEQAAQEMLACIEEAYQIALRKWGENQRCGYDRPKPEKGRGYALQEISRREAIENLHGERRSGVQAQHFAHAVLRRS